MWSKCGFDVVNWIHATTIIGVHLSAIKIHHIGNVPLQFYSTSKYTTTYTFDVFLDQNSLIFHIPPTARFFPSSLSLSLQVKMTFQMPPNLRPGLTLPPLAMLRACDAPSHVPHGRMLARPVA